jgi:hypothetical protein
VSRQGPIHHFNNASWFGQASILSNLSSLYARPIGPQWLRIAGNRQSLQKLTVRVLAGYWPMTIRMRATPLGSAVPTLANKDPSVETATDFEIALRHLQQVAQRLRAADERRETASDQENPVRKIKR